METLRNLVGFTDPFGHRFWIYDADVVSVHEAYFDKKDRFVTVITTGNGHVWMTEETTDSVVKRVRPVVLSQVTNPGVAT